MASSPFYEDGSTLLTADAFEFVLDRELKRAMRGQNFLTLVTLETSREWEGMLVAAADGVMLELAQIASGEIRDADHLGRTGIGALGLLLLDSDFDQAAAVVARLVARIENYEFPIPLRIAVGAACCPTHAVDADSLKRQALSRPLVSWRGGG